MLVKFVLAFMNALELRQFKVVLLDGIHELATHPVADPEVVKRTLKAIFSRLEEYIGEETRTPAR